MSTDNMETPAKPGEPSFECCDERWPIEDYWGCPRCHTSARHGRADLARRGRGERDDRKPRSAPRRHRGTAFDGLLP